MRIGPSCACTSRATRLSATSALRIAFAYDPSGVGARALQTSATFPGACPTKGKGKEKDRWGGWQPVIGLELHVQLKGNLKLLSCKFGLAGEVIVRPNSRLIRALGLQPRELYTTTSPTNTSQLLTVHSQVHSQ